MTKKILITLPVRDLKKSKAFYEAIGATNNPQFTSDGGAYMVFSDTIALMLITYETWAMLTKKAIVDAHKASEVALALSCDSRDAVNAMLDAVGKAGGAVDVNPVDDYEFMLRRDFEDLDGHSWGAMWMDPSKA